MSTKSRNNLYKASSATIVQQQSAQISELTAIIGQVFTDPAAAKAKFAELAKPKEERKMYVKEGALFKRNDGYWEARLRIDGVQTTIAKRKRQIDAYNALKEAIEEKNSQPQKLPQKSFTLFSWLDHWHKVFRIPKMMRNELAESTIIGDKTNIRKIKKTYNDVKLKDLSADYIQIGIDKVFETEPRSAEAMYFTLKMALHKAKTIIGHDVMEFVERIKHERVSGRALSVSEVDIIMQSCLNQLELDILHCYLYTGVRPDELTREKVLYINLTSEPRLLTGLTFMSKPVPDVLLRPNHIFIDGTKNPLSQRCMPIFPQLRPVLERLCEGRKPEDKLFNMHYEQIRQFQRRIKLEKEIDFTLKDFRHTCATNCKESGIPIEVFHKWFGWSSLRMAKQVYTHETELDIEKGEEYSKTFSVCATTSGIREGY